MLGVFRSVDSRKSFFKRVERQKGEEGDVHSNLLTLFLLQLTLSSKNGRKRLALFFFVSIDREQEVKENEKKYA